MTNTEITYAPSSGRTPDLSVLIGPDRLGPLSERSQTPDVFQTSSPFGRFSIHMQPNPSEGDRSETGANDSRGAYAKLPEVTSPSIVAADLTSDMSLAETALANDLARPESGRAKKLHFIHRNCDVYEELLERGEAVVPLSFTTGDIHFNKLAELMGCTREDLRIASVRERIILWKEKYGLSLPKHERRTGLPIVVEFATLMISERKRQLKEEEGTGSKNSQQCAAALSNTRWALNALTERYPDSANARASINELLELAAAGQVKGEKKLREELQRGLKLLDDVETNGGLPLDVADMIQFAMDRAGVKDADVARDLGFRREHIWGMRTGAKAPPLWAFEDHAKLERYLNLPEGAILARARRKRRGIGAVPLDLFPPEFRGRKNWIRFEMLKHLTPEDIVEDDAKRHANMRRIATTLDSKQSQYTEVLKKQRSIPYRWGEAEWEYFDVRAEWDSYVSFRTGDDLPFGMNRADRIPREKTFVLYQDYFSSLFGTWTAVKNAVFTMDPHDVSFAYLVFPRLFDIRLQVARGWSKECGGGGATPVADIQRIHEIRGLLHPETGWLTQSPELAEKLKPVISKKGEVIVSQEDIDKVTTSWREACDRARVEYAKMQKSHRKHCKRRRNAHESVLPILKLQNPALAFQMLGLGLLREPVEQRSYGHACLVRDQVLIGIMIQCAFRRETLSKLNLNHLEYDASEKVWWLRIERECFKNEDGPYFVRPSGEVQDYGRRLKDRYGLYDAIELYLSWARGVVLAGSETNALLVCAPRRKRKSRGLKFHPENGRFIPGSINKLVDRLTARHVGYKPKTGEGIEGVTSFPPHAFRHILATAVLKASTANNPWQEAADVIHDGEEAVRKNYARYVPRDREHRLTATMEAAFDLVTTCPPSQW